MILKPPEQTAENAFSHRKMYFPAERCLFLQKHALSCRKMWFPPRESLKFRKCSKRAQAWWRLWCARPKYQGFCSSCLEGREPPLIPSIRIVMGKSLDSPENGNVDEMSEKCRKNVRKMSKNCPEGPKTQFRTFFWTIFAHLVDAFVWWPCPMHARYNIRTLTMQRGKSASMRKGKWVPQKSRKSLLWVSFWLLETLSAPGGWEVSPRGLGGCGTLRLLNALNSEDRGLKVRFSLATIALDRESAQICQILSSQGKNAPSNPYPHYLVRLAASREPILRLFSNFFTFRLNCPSEWPKGSQS